MPCRVIGRAAARSVAVAGPPAASAARMARRLESTSAMNTASATISGVADSGASSGTEVGDQLVELTGPAAHVAGERLLVLGRPELGEAALDHGHAGAVALG